MKTTAAVFATFCMASALAADDPKQKQDLTAVIALQGKPCGEVVSYVAKADNDFVAGLTCTVSGNSAEAKLAGTIT